MVASSSIESTGRVSLKAMVSEDLSIGPCALLKNIDVLSREIARTPEHMNAFPVLFNSGLGKRLTKLRVGSDLLAILAVDLTPSETTRTALTTFPLVVEAIECRFVGRTLGFVVNLLNIHISLLVCDQDHPNHNRSIHTFIRLCTSTRIN